MVTKSGKHHWKYTLTTYGRDGHIIFNGEQVCYTDDFSKYIEKSRRRYEAHGVTLEATNAIDLDKKC